MIPYKLIINGRPYSKKNSRRHISQYSKKKGTFYTSSLPSINYKSFEEDAAYQLLGKRHFTGKILIDYVFHKNGESLQDLDNAVTSINDVLEHSHIVDNDKHIIIGSVYPVTKGKEWYTELYIQEFTNTSMIWVDHPTLGISELNCINYAQGRALLRPVNETKMYDVGVSELSTQLGIMRRQIMESLPQ